MLQCCLTEGTNDRSTDDDEDDESDDPDDDQGKNGMFVGMCQRSPNGSPDFDNMILLSSGGVAMNKEPYSTWYQGDEMEAMEPFQRTTVKIVVQNEDEMNENSKDAITNENIIVIEE